MKRKEPTQTERLTRALLAGKKVDRYYALNTLRIAHPGARIEDIRNAYIDDDAGEMLAPLPALYIPSTSAIATVRDGKRSYYTIPPAYRAEVRRWWKERAK